MKYLIGDGLTTTDFDEYIKECFELNGIKVLKRMPTTDSIDALFLELACDSNDILPLDEKVYDLLFGLYEISKETNPPLASKLGVVNSTNSLLYLYIFGAKVPYEDGVIMTFANYLDDEELLFWKISPSKFLGE